MSTHQSLSSHSRFAMLAFVPVGLLVLTMAMREGALAAGDGLSSMLPIDLLALAMGALLGWLGGEFAPRHDVPVAHRSERRRIRRHLTHTTV